MKENRKLTAALSYAFLIVFGIGMIYPFVWMIFAAFKTNAEIFGSTKLLPSTYSFESFVKGWRGSGQYNFSRFTLNTLALVLPTVFFTLLSCAVTAFGFARFRFPGKKLLFAVMISTLMLPNAVIVIPRYLLFNKLGWLNSYLPFIVPAAFACYPFFIFMLVQFLRGIPIELDESAHIDGCGSVRLFSTILVPLMKPALFSVGLFQFMWTWNDFYNPLIYINSVRKFPISLGLRVSLDAASVVAWNNVMAMSMVTILPLIILFFFSQKYFVEGIATTGLKG